MLKHENASTSPARHPVRALVLLPTRELADQVAQQVKLYAKYTNLRSAVVFGGMDMKPQTLELKKGCRNSGGHPGALAGPHRGQERRAQPGGVCGAGRGRPHAGHRFLPDLQRILSYLPKQRTTLLFSATFSPEIKRWPTAICKTRSRLRWRVPMPRPPPWSSIFTACRRRQTPRPAPDSEISAAEAGLCVCQQQAGLCPFGAHAGARRSENHRLHGDKSQDERLKALDAFKKGEVDLLVCTDVAARGLDIKDVPAVFNFDIPFNAEDYMHRIGRTGRAGAEGLAVSFVGGNNDARLVGDIEKLIKTKIELEAVEFDEDLPDIRKQGRINDGRRMYHQEGTGDNGRTGARGRQPGPRDDHARAAVARATMPVRGTPRDPFFDKPYEPTPANSRRTSWEASARPACTQHFVQHQAQGEGCGAVQSGIDQPGFVPASHCT
jgi:ATP-dependent RNA helicase RhlE